MDTISDIKCLFDKAGIKLFEAVDDFGDRKEILFSGDNDLNEFMEYLTLNTIKFVFYNYSEVSEESLIDVSLITKDDYGVEAKRFLKEAMEYNDGIHKNIGRLLSASIFTVQNGVIISVFFYSDLNEKIFENGERALDRLTSDYLDDVECYKIEREQELLHEIEEERVLERKQKIDTFYKLLEKDQYFNSLSTKDGRIMRATEIVSSIGLKETKTNIVGYLDVYAAKKKLLSNLSKN